MNNLKNNKGFSLVMLLIVLGVLAMVTIWYSVYKDSGSSLNVANIKKVLDEDKAVEDEEVVFEDIPEDEYTPVEINNEALDELDSIMESLEEEDLSDLSDL
ncbi:hypothetical protein ACFLZK_00450 [Patescibacteria group bacterium]